jgi:hypothetical protein
MWRYEKEHVIIRSSAELKISGRTQKFGSAGYFYCIKKTTGNAGGSKKL